MGVQTNCKARAILALTRDLVIIGTIVGVIGAEVALCVHDVRQTRAVAAQYDEIAARDNKLAEEYRSMAAEQVSRYNEITERYRKMADDWRSLRVIDAQPSQ